MKQKSALRAAFPHTIPVMFGYLFRCRFRILLSSKGYHWGWAVLMSVFIYAGSMQFVAIGILTGPFLPLQAVLMTLMVNARHGFYGISMLTKLKNMGKKKPYMIFSLTDETFSLLCSAKAPQGVDKNWFSVFYFPLRPNLLGDRLRGGRHYRLACFIQHKRNRFCNDRPIHRYLCESVGRE